MSRYCHQILWVFRFALAGALTALAPSTSALEPVSSAATTNVPAFPGAEGYGARTAGGRGGRVIAVTNLNDSGPGSLGAACEAAGPRMVIFKVAGTIDGDIKIQRDSITIAGQSAPGDGITIKGKSEHRRQ